MGGFENLQNTDLNARNPFSAIRPKQNMNDFGAYGGGPVWIPKLYNGRNRTFFFMSYENLILKQQSVLVESVPSLALRNGDLSAYSKQIYNPGTGVPYPNNQIPTSQITPLSAAALKYLFPLPNTGAPNAIANNFVDNLATPRFQSTRRHEAGPGDHFQADGVRAVHLQASRCDGTADRLFFAGSLFKTGNRFRIDRGL